MRISSADIVPGFVLAAAVENAQGQMLLPRGTTLVDKHVRLLKSWAIDAIEVDDAVIPSTPDGNDSSDQAEDLAALDARFAPVRGDPVLDRLRDLMERRIRSVARS